MVFWMTSGAILTPWIVRSVPPYWLPSVGETESIDTAQVKTFAPTGLATAPPRDLVSTERVYTPGSPPGMPALMQVLLSLSTFSWYVFALLMRLTVTSPAVLPNISPKISMTPFIAGFQEEGEIELITGAVREASTKVNFKDKSAKVPETIVTAESPKVGQGGTMNDSSMLDCATIATVVLQSDTLTELRENPLPVIFAKYPPLLPPLLGVIIATLKGNIRGDTPVAREAYPTLETNTEKDGVPPSIIGEPSVFSFILQENELILPPEITVQGFPLSVTVTLARENPMLVGSLRPRLSCDPERVRDVTSVRRANLYEQAPWHAEAMSLTLTDTVGVGEAIWKKRQSMGSKRRLGEYGLLSVKTTVGGTPTAPPVREAVLGIRGGTTELTPQQQMMQRVLQELEMGDVEMTSTSSYPLILLSADCKFQDDRLQGRAVLEQFFVVELYNPRATPPILSPKVPPKRCAWGVVIAYVNTPSKLELQLILKPSADWLADLIRQRLIVHSQVAARAALVVLMLPESYIVKVTEGMNELQVSNFFTAASTAPALALKGNVAVALYVLSKVAGSILVTERVMLPKVAPL